MARQVVLQGTFNCWNKASNTRRHGAPAEKKRTVRLDTASLWVTGESAGATIINWMMKDMEAFDERRVNIDKELDGSIGLSILGGVDRGEPITVGRLVDNSPAQRCGKVLPKDVILDVNGHSTLTCTHSEVTQLLQEAGDTVCLHLVKLRQKANSVDFVEGAAPVDIVQLIGDHVTEISLEAATLTRYCNNELIPNGYRIINRDSSLDYTLQCCDEDQQLDQWISLLTDTIMKVNSSKVRELNEQFGLDDIIMFGNVHELLPSSKYSNNWLRKLLVLRKATLEIFSSLPQCIEKWVRPEQSYKLHEISVRQVKCNELPVAAATVASTVILQCGTGHNNIISFEYSNVLNEWKDTIYRATVTAVVAIKQREFDANWKGQKVVFCINLQRGFVIMAPADTNTPEVLWSQPFSQLSRSSDDGHTVMVLTFKNGTSVQINMAHDLHIAICTMEAFLRTKVAQQMSHQ